MSALDSIQIVNKCPADWNAMTGDERVRHCEQCSLNVYNVAALSESEALSLIENTEGRVCVRLYRRADGTVITRDCPVAATRRRRMAVVASLATGLLTLAATATAFAFRRSPTQCTTANTQNAATYTPTGLGNVEPFKTLARWAPGLFPKPVPAPATLYVQMGEALPAVTPQPIPQATPQTGTKTTP